MKSVELKQEEWQAVVNILARAPFNEVAQLINAIAQQLQAEQPKPHFREVTGG